MTTGDERQVADAEQRQALEAAIGPHEPGDEVARPGAARISAGGPNCATIPPVSEHRDEVAHLDRLVDVVGHEQDRLGELLLEAQELVLEALADDRVDGAERLVHEHDRRVRGERPGDADALPLAAGELRRVAPRVRRGLQARRARAAPRPARAMRAFGQPSRRGTVTTFSSIVWCGNRPVCWMT